jgi:nucleotide-binding universal stress UspA family protein
MVKRILLGIGGTPFTPVAIKRAVELAERHAARLKAVTVVNPNQICKLGPVPPGAGFFAKKMCENRLEITRAQVEESIASLEARCAESKVRLSVEREAGKPFELIIAHARYHDLTIFGLRSMFEYRLAKEPEKDLFRLLSNGVRPIIAVSDRFRTINKVLIAYNGSVESANAMQHFVRLSLWPGATLDIVTIGDNPESDPNLLEDAAAYCTDHGYTVNTHLRAGKAIDQLLPIAREIDADMIVMGRSLRSMLVRHVLGDTVLNTLAHTPLPLFLSQ